MNTEAPLSPERSLADALRPPATDRSSPSLPPWKLLVVDDEPEVHSVTRLALSDFRFAGRGLDFISAYSGKEAKTILANDPEIAVMLLDVVMETDDAGLQVIQYLRHTVGNHFLRVILRTGHPGMAPERRVIRTYDINDYRAKTELTQDRMFSLMYTSLAAYQRLSRLAHSQRVMQCLVDEYRSVLERIATRLAAPTAALLRDSKAVREATQQPEGQTERHALQDIERQCARIQSAVAALGELGDLAATEEVPQVFNAEEAAQEALARLQPLVRERGARIRLDSLPALHGYRPLFIELLERLLANAIEHQSGQTPEVELSIQARGRDWQFSVADRGPGVPVDRAEDIFQAFARIDEDEKVASVGMGLAVCRKIVAMHGGKLWYAPRPGGGALFHFTIPAAGALYGDE